MPEIQADKGQKKRFDVARARLQMRFGDGGAARVDASTCARSTTTRCPTSPNYVHIKMKAGGSPNNRVAPGNWPIGKTRLDAGVGAWNADGRTTSTQAF